MTDATLISYGMNMFESYLYHNIYEYNPQSLVVCLPRGAR